MDGKAKESLASVTILSDYRGNQTSTSKITYESTRNVKIPSNNNSILIDKGTITLEKSQRMSTNQTSYSSTEIDSKLGLVNQKIEHNQEKMALIVSNALDKIGDKIAHLETNLDKKLSDFKAEIFGFLIISLLVPFLTVMIPIINESIKDMNSRNSLVAPANNQSK